MKTQVSKLALLALQWSLGIILFLQAESLAFSSAEIQFSGHPGVHHWIRLALAWSEMLACLVFLLPHAVKYGAALLLTVFALAALVHVLHGNFQIGDLFILATAVVVVASQAHPEPPATQP
jgi:uncharacterized membrane protein YphA (DoxX/SURF4 family)